MTDRHADGITRNGLRVDPAKQRAWQARGAKTYAANRELRRQQARQAKNPAAKKPKNRNDWPPLVAKLAKARSRGICERCGWRPACRLHHRKRRDHRDHRIQNAFHVCLECHDLIHGIGKDGSIETSRLMGWIVPAGADPAKVTVMIAPGERVLLDDRGGYTEAEAA